LSKVKLSEVSKKIFSGLTPLRSNQDFWIEGTIPWLKTEQLGKNKYIYDTNEKITEQALNGTSIKLCPNNTLSIAMYGEGKTRGSVSIIKQTMTTNQACCNVFIDENKACYEYVYYFLKTQYYELRNLSSGVRKNLNSNDIKNFEIRLPADIKEQQKIASILSTLDKKIELNNQINQNLEAMAKTLYDYWFVQFDFPFDFAKGKPDEKGKPYKSSGGKMVYSEELKREIPEGWSTQYLIDFIDENKSGDWGKEKKEGNYTKKVSCIRGADFPALNGNGEIKTPIRYILEKNTHKLLDANDVIIEISGGSPTQSTGRLTFITNDTLKRFDNSIICSNFCRALSLKEKNNLYYFVNTWNLLYANRVMFGWEGKTSGLKNLLLNNMLESVQVVVPNCDLNKKFYGLLDSFQKTKQTNLLETQKLTQLRNWLLPMLMNGQVSVGRDIHTPTI